MLSIHYLFTNKQNELFMLCKLYDDYKTLSNENNHRYAFNLYKITPENLELITTIRPDNVHLRHLNTTLLNDNELVLTGLYSIKNMYAMKGVFSAKVDLTTGKLAYSKYNDFSC